MRRERVSYDEFVMDHIRNARNFRPLPDANRAATGANPLCGDAMTLQLRVVRNRVEAAAFQCECCGVSMASASMMTDWVAGKEVEEARRFARLLAESLAGKAGSAVLRPGPMERALLATARDFPARSRCAVLPWTALEDALGGK